MPIHSFGETEALRRVVGSMSGLGRLRPRPSPVIGRGCTTHVPGDFLRLDSLETTFDNGGQIPLFNLWSPISQPKGLNVPSSVIEEDLTIEGNIRSSEGSVDINGRVVGDVSAEIIAVQLSGSVDGAMSATKIAVEGSHTGSLKCDDLKLASTSQVQADVVAKVMATESGAKVKGKIDITGRQ